MANEDPQATAAAPVGVAPVAVYALRDVCAHRGGKSQGGEMQGGESVVVHPKGHKQMLDPGIAREVVRTSPEDYGYAHPDGDMEAAIAVAPASAQERLAALLADPELVATLRHALATTEPAQPVPGAPVAVPATETDPPPPAGPFLLTSLPGVNEKVARAMEDAKLGTLEQLQEATLEQIAAVHGVGNKLAERIAEHIKTHHPKREG